MKPIDSSALSSPAASRRGDKTRSAFEVSFSPDEMKAYLLIYPPPNGHPKPAWEEVKEHLRQEGIRFGLKEDIVRNMLENDIYNQKIEIAQGQEAILGEDAKLELSFDIAPQGDLVVGGDGRIDFRDWSIIQNVKLGQTLVEKTQVNSGKFGTTVTGKKITVRPGRDIKLPVGLNTQVNPTDSLQLVSRMEGTIIYKNQRVHIQPLQVLKGNVDYTTGSINYVGSLRVPGNIKSGFSVTPDGNLEVDGDVRDAILKVGGDVLIKGGFLGLGKGKLDCRGRVMVKYVENQSIVSGEDILIGGEVVNSSLSANKSLKVVGPKGMIVGGDCVAEKLIEAEILGDEKGTLTKIRVAYDPKLMDEYKEIEYELDKLDQNSQRIKGVLYNFEKMEMEGQLSDKDKMMFNKLKDVQNNIAPQMKKLNSRKKELEVRMNKNLDAKVIVKQKVYSGVELYFGILKHKIEKEMEPTVFEVKEGKIEARNYK